MSKEAEHDTGPFWIQQKRNYYKLQPAEQPAELWPYEFWITGDSFRPSWRRVLKDRVIELDTVEELESVSNAQTWNEDWEKVLSRIQLDNVCIVSARVVDVDGWISPDRHPVWMGRFCVKGMETQDDRILRPLHRDCGEHLWMAIRRMAIREDPLDPLLERSMGWYENTGMELSTEDLSIAKESPITALPTIPTLPVKCARRVVTHEYMRSEFATKEQMRNIKPRRVKRRKKVDWRKARTLPTDRPPVLGSRRWPAFYYKPIDPDADWSQ